MSGQAVHRVPQRAERGSDGGEPAAPHGVLPDHRAHLPGRRGRQGGPQDTATTALHQRWATVGTGTSPYWEILLTFLRSMGEGIGFRIRPRTVAFM